MNSTPSQTAAPLGVGARLAGILAAWSLIYMSSPGIVVPSGLALLAPIGAGLWAFFASRPGRRAFAVEALVACAAWCGICSWAALVHWSSLLFIGPGFGLYYAGAGVLLRRLSRDWPLAIAAPAAWMAIETLRSVLEPPFGLNWMRLGVNWHELEWLTGSARVWGVWGLSYVVIALGGGVADLAVCWRSQDLMAQRRRRWAVAAGGGPLLFAAALSAWTSAPETELGPRVLLVQPAFAQERKMNREQTSLELFQESRALTAKGLDEAERAGERAVDLVAWGETMLPMYLADPALHEAVAQGALPPPWANWGGPIDEATLTNMDRQEDNWLREAILAPGRGAVLPVGTVFLSGVEYLTVRDRVIGRQNSVVIWNSDGTRSRAVSKSHLVPGAETMLGLERFEGVRNTIFKLAGYVPDLISHEGSRTLRFVDRAGREYVFGVAVCFDNAFDGPFVEPLLEGPTDFNLVASNEAWFKNGQEPDQMMAFSRLAAIATGRSIVRATNSGISAVLGPDGREVARLVVGGLDREVAGTLRADVPIPRVAERTSNTLYVRTWRIWPAMGLLWPLLLILGASRLRGGYRSGVEG